MKGLLIKEMITNLKNNKIYFIIIPAFALFGLLNKQNMFLMLIPMLLSMLPLGQMSYDEISHWDKYVYCMPVSKKTIVSSRYISIAIMSLISALIIAVIMLLVSLNSPEAFKEVLSMSVIALLIGAFVPCISLPINYKFGTIKGRIVNLILIGIICSSVSTIILSDSSKLSESLIKLFSNTTLFCAAAVGALAVMLLISWFISVKIYEAKEA
jgi:hypothetical protein